MWAVAAQPRTELTPMMPTPSVDSGARGDLTSKLLLGGVDESAPYQGSPPRSDRHDRLVDEYLNGSTSEHGIRRYAKDQWVARGGGRTLRRKHSSYGSLPRA